MKGDTSAQWKHQEPAADQRCEMTCEHRCDRPKGHPGPHELDYGTLRQVERVALPVVCGVITDLGCCTLEAGHTGAHADTIRGWSWSRLPGFAVQP